MPLRRSHGVPFLALWGPEHLSITAYPVPSFVGSPCPVGSPVDHEEWRTLSAVAEGSGSGIGA